MLLFATQSSEGSSCASPVENEQTSPISQPTEDLSHPQSLPKSPPATASKIPRFNTAAPASRIPPPKVIPRMTPNADSIPDADDEVTEKSNDEVQENFSNTGTAERPKPAPRPKSKIPNPFHSTRDETKVVRSTNPFLRSPDGETGSLNSHSFGKQKATEPEIHSRTASPPPLPNKVDNVEKEAVDKNSKNQDPHSKLSNTEVAKPSSIPRPGSSIPTPSSRKPTTQSASVLQGGGSSIPSPTSSALPVLKSTSALPVSSGATTGSGIPLPSKKDHHQHHHATTSSVVSPCIFSLSVFECWSELVTAGSACTRGW